MTRTVIVAVTVVSVFYAGMEVGWKMHIYAQRKKRDDLAKNVEKTISDIKDGKITLEELLAKAKEMKS